MNPRESEAATEEKLGHAMVKARLLTDNQLKAAFDYHRSLGGTLLEVVTKLGFVHPHVLSRFLSELNAYPAGSHPTQEEATAGSLPRRPSPPEELRSSGEAGEEPEPIPAVVDAGAEEAREAGVLPDTGTLPARWEIDPVLQALIDLLLGKGVIQREELEDMLYAEGRLGE